MIENETKEETEIRTRLSAEKFKWGIHLEDLRSEQYEIWLNNVDANMITYFTANYENDICGSLIELWERDCKNEEEKSIKIFHGKEDWYLNNASSGFRNTAQSLRQERKPQDSRTSKNFRKGRNRHNQQRKKKKKKKKKRTVLEVEVTTTITQINLQQTNPIKMTEKNGLH